MKVVGYGERFSVAPGEVIQFMVSCELPSYQADDVRLIHGDVSAAGPGFKEEVVDTAIGGRYPGRTQTYRHGSYVRVPDNPLLRDLQSFTLTVWLYPTRPAKGVQGVLGIWSPDNTGFQLVIDEAAALALWLGAPGGQVERVSTGAAMRAGTWYFAAASYDAEHGRVLLVQRPARAWPIDSSKAFVDRSVRPHATVPSRGPLLIAALWTATRRSHTRDRRAFQRQA